MTCDGGTYAERPRVSIWKSLAATLAVAWAAVVAMPAAQAGTAELLRMLDSSFGRFILSRTEPGAQLATRVLGQELGEGADLTALLTRLESRELSRVQRGFERSLTRVREKFRAQYGEDALATNGRALRELEEQFLRELVARELRLDPMLFPPSMRGGYSLSREMFLRGTGFTPSGAERLLRFPRGVDPMAHPDWNLQFGFESEYALDECGRLLEVYGPREAESGITRGQWLNMSEGERVAWVRAKLASVPINAEMAGLVKLVDAPEFSALPEELVFDSTGNLEIVMRPVQTLEEWHQQVQLINERFGAGSMQGAISSPSDPFFGRVQGASIDRAVKEDLGFLNFINDFDVLQKLEAGAARYAADPSRPVAQGFQHPWLGPMTRMKQLRLERFLAKNALGEYYEPNRLINIRSREGSFKYVGSTSYRPDIAGPERAVFEIRDAHKNFELLLDRMLRSTFYLQWGRGQFAAAAELKALDAVADFEKLSPAVRRMLEQVFPARIKPEIVYDEENRIAAEVFRNFAYPMRDWNPMLRFLGRPTLAVEVARAQANYVSKLERIAEELAAGAITKQQAFARVQGALAQFADESGLARAYGAFQERNVFGNESFDRYMALTVKELGPMTRAFPRSAWTGELGVRLQRFANRWPQNAKVVESVRFPFEGVGGFRREAGRKVLVISQEGLDSIQKAALLKDYVDAFAQGTVSFPVGERGGTLYTRVGSRAFYWTGGTATESSYGVSSSRRLEPMVLLTPEEELRLRFYVDLSTREGSRMLGGFRSDPGVPDGATASLLRDNRPVASNHWHNCTTWMCTAPIGSGNQHLHELVGASRGFEVYSNPGWWNQYLGGAARADRVGAIVFWTDQSLAAELTRIRPGEPMIPWDYALH